MRAWIRRLVGLPAVEQLERIEENGPSLEERVERLVARMGGYAKKDQTELDEIIADIKTILDTLDRILNTLELVAYDGRAKNLRRRLKNNLTRAEKARAA